MATVVKITIEERNRLKKRLGMWGAKKQVLGYATYTTVNKLLKTREASETTIANLSECFGYKLELEQDKIPA